MIDVYNNIEIIKDFLSELELFIESVKTKIIIKENDFSNASRILEEKWIEINFFD